MTEMNENDVASRVLVAYEPTAKGRAALMHAADIARDRRLPLTVVSVTECERTDSGCGRCRRSAIMWNYEMGELVEETLAEAAALLEEADLDAVEYVTARGDRSEAIEGAVAEAGADLVVVPFEQPRVLGMFSRRTLATRLAADPQLTVISVPAGPAPR